MTRARPRYLLISLGLHAAVLLSLLLVSAPRLPEVRQRRVVIELSPRRELARPEEAGPDPQRAEILAPEVEPLAASLDLEGPASLAAPSARLPVDAPAVPPEAPAAGRAELPSPESSRAAAAPRAELRLPRPAAETILADLPSPGQEASRAVPVPAAAPPAGYLDPGALEWRGRERKVIKAARPEFPEVLLQEGQEVDVEATFKVAP
ncbi:MAG: hypothetical protein JW820_01250, partial [Spirochaetales bacterium]|nr:hypothetical protein [Spirochaetales bacterium]